MSIPHGVSLLPLFVFTSPWLRLYLPFETECVHSMKNIVTLTILRLSWLSLCQHTLSFVSPTLNFTSPTLSFHFSLTEAYLPFWDWVRSQHKEYSYFNHPLIMSVAFVSTHTEVCFSHTEFHLSLETECMSSKRMCLVCACLRYCCVNPFILSFTSPTPGSYFAFKTKSLYAVRRVAAANEYCCRSLI